MERFSSILVVIGGEPYDATMTRAVTLAMKNGARLTIMDVVAPISTSFFATEAYLPQNLESDAVAERRNELMQIASQYVATGIEAAVVVRVGNPAIEIVSEVIDSGHDLVIKTANTQTGLKHLLGSVTRALMRTCPCPVWAIKPSTGANYHTIVAAIDPLADDPEHIDLNDTLFELAISLARDENAALHLVSVWNVPMERTLRSRLGTQECDRLIREAESQVRQSLDKWLAKHTPAPNEELPPIRVHLLQGTASDKIAEVATESAADLIVMGTVCRSGLAGLFVGNTAEHLLGWVTCGVLAVKPKDFVSPVRVHHTA
ncbi:MAG TPA: universal stress protein [Planctomycetaceae bacterium]|nr:universal stress protein [Planctomycetaceae bacterium]